VSWQKRFSGKSLPIFLSVPALKAAKLSALPLGAMRFSGP